MKKTNLFNTPERTRVLWHDLKTFPSAIHVYLDSILNGTYGKVPTQLTPIMQNLKAAAIKNILTIENISILHKIENDSLVTKSNKLLLDELASSALNFLLPLTLEDKKSVSLKINKGAALISDTRYSSTILQNMLVLALHFSAPGASITLTSEQGGIVIRSQTKATNQTILDQTLAKHIYNPEQTAETLPALIFYTTDYLANKLGFIFKILVEKNNLSIYYVKS